MKENNDENSKKDSSIDKETNPIDLTSMMQLATTLLTNDTLMNSIGGLSKNSSNPKHSVLNNSQKQENAEISSISQKLENIHADLSSLKKEIEDLKAQQNGFSHLLTKFFRGRKEKSKHKSK